SGAPHDDHRRASRTGSARLARQDGRRPADVRAGGYRRRGLAGVASCVIPRPTVLGRDESSALRRVTMSEILLTRRGLLTKLGVLFNGLFAAALTVPIVGYLLSAITRGRASGYLSWVTLGSISAFPEG